MKAYKLFAIKDYDLYSLVDYWNPEAKVGKYDRDTWNLRRKSMGPFCCFTEFSAMMKFKNSIKDKAMPYEVHEIEAKVDGKHYSPWHCINVYRSNSDLPTGTVLIDSFKLKRMVYNVTIIPKG